MRSVKRVMRCWAQQITFAITSECDLSPTSICKETPRRNFRNFIRKTIRIRWQIPSQRLICSFLDEIWCLTFASEFWGRVRIRMGIHNCAAATAVHSAVPEVQGDESVTFLAGHGEICHPHGWSTWRPADQPTTRQSTWISCYGFLLKRPQSMWIGVLWAGLRVAMWITHVGGKFRHGLLEKSLNEILKVCEWKSRWIFGGKFSVHSPRKIRL